MKYTQSFSVFRKIALLTIAWLIVISVAHFWFNVERVHTTIIKMGYMPVVTNLAAPLLDSASKNKPVWFKALKFSSFAEMAEAFRSDRIDVAFIIAPLALVLRQQGVPLKVVYIGNRHESTMVVRSNETIFNFSDLYGKTVAVPLRYSCHNLLLLKLAQECGIANHIHIVEMQPPDMASALAAGSLDGYFVGEPFAAQTVMSGKAKVLFYAEDKWKNFICNVMVVHEKLIDTHPQIVQKLVQGAILSGIWASHHIDEAVKIASRYWNQKPMLVRYALSTPHARVRFDLFKPQKKEFDEIARLMIHFGLMEKRSITDELIDARFCDRGWQRSVEKIDDIIADPH